MVSFTYFLGLFDFFRLLASEQQRHGTEPDIKKREVLDRLPHGVTFAQFANRRNSDVRHRVRIAGRPCNWRRSAACCRITCASTEDSMTMSERHPPTATDEEGVSEFSNEMGIESIGVIDGAFTMELDLEQRHMSRANRAHGGVLFTMLDSVLGRAILEALPEGRGCATVEIKINYFRPVQRGRITARGWKRELTKSLGYAEGEIVNEAGKVLARASGTFFLTNTMRQDDRERI